MLPVGCTSTLGTVHTILVLHVNPWATHQLHTGDHDATAEQASIVQPSPDRFVHDLGVLAPLAVTQYKRVASRDHFMTPPPPLTFVLLIFSSKSWINSPVTCGLSSSCFVCVGGSLDGLTQI